MVRGRMGDIWRVCAFYHSFGPILLSNTRTDPSPRPATMSERWESQDRLVTQLSAPVGMSWWTRANTQINTAGAMLPLSLQRSFHSKPSLKSLIMCSVYCWLVWSWTEHQYAATGEAGPFVLVLSPSILTMISTLRTIRCVKPRGKKKKWKPQ